MAEHEKFSEDAIYLTVRTYDDGMSVIMNADTDSLYVKKTLSDYNAAAYEYLKTHEDIQIPEVYSVKEEDGKLTVIEEFIHGKKLDELLRGESKLSFLDRKRILFAVCEGMNFLHSADPRIVHGDLKPSDILIMDDGTVKITGYNTALTDANADISALGALIRQVLPESAEALKIADMAEKAVTEKTPAKDKKEPEAEEAPVKDEKVSEAEETPVKDEKELETAAEGASDKAPLTVTDIKEALGKLSDPNDRRHVPGFGSRSIGVRIVSWAVLAAAVAAAIYGIFRYQKAGEEEVTVQEAEAVSQRELAGLQDGSSEVTGASSVSVSETSEAASVSSAGYSEETASSVSLSESTEASEIPTASSKESSEVNETASASSSESSQVNETSSVSSAESSGVKEISSVSSGETSETKEASSEFAKEMSDTDEASTVSSEESSEVKEASSASSSESSEVKETSSASSSESSEVKETSSASPAESSAVIEASSGSLKETSDTKEVSSESAKETSDTDEVSAVSSEESSEGKEAASLSSSGTSEVKEASSVSSMGSSEITDTSSESSSESSETQTGSSSEEETEEEKAAREAEEAFAETMRSAAADISVEKDAQTVIEKLETYMAEADEYSDTCGPEGKETAERFRKELIAAGMNSAVRHEDVYRVSGSLYSASEAIRIFETLGNYTENADMASQAFLNSIDGDAAKAMANGKLNQAEKLYSYLSGVSYDGADNGLKNVAYQRALKLVEAGNWLESAEMFDDLSGYKDADEQAAGCRSHYSSYINAAANAESGIAVSWIQLDEADGYILEMDDSVTVDLGPESYSYTFLEANKNGQEYSFTVTPYFIDEEGNKDRGGESPAFTWTFLDKVYIQNLSSYNSEEVTVAWTPNTYAGYYEVAYGLSPELTSAVVVMYMADQPTTQKIDGFISGTLYYFKVRSSVLGADNKIYSGAWSDTLPIIVG